MASHHHDPAPQETAILRAALETIAENKISGTRMRLIAARAGMSQGNLHHYFATKTDLLLALLDEMLATFVREREEWLNKTELAPREKLADFIEQKKRLLLARKALMQAYHDFWVHGTTDPAIQAQFQRMYDKWRGDIQTVVDEGVRRGVFDAQPAAAVPGLLVALMEGIALQYLVDPDRFDLDGHFQVANRMVFRLLGVQDDTPAVSNPMA